MKNSFVSKDASLKLMLQILKSLLLGKRRLTLSRSVPDFLNFTLANAWGFYSLRGDASDRKGFLHIHLNVVAVT